MEETLIPIGGCIFYLIALLLLLVSVALVVWALIDAIKNPYLSDNERIVWILVIIFVGCIGPILYLLIGRNARPDATPPRRYEDE